MVRVYYDRFTSIGKNNGSQWERVTKEFKTAKEAQEFARRIVFTIIVKNVTIDYHAKHL